VYPGPTYGSEIGTSGRACIAHIDVGGAAARAGLAAGDVIVSANRRSLRDVIDWRWEADGPVVLLEVDSGAERRSVTLERAPDETWGFDFTDVVFDGVRTCNNACAFCFMAQLPRGLRPALYLRDDDYRLSFLQGNFVTLTNVDDQDIDRIVDQHLSPLYMSLHAVSPEIRASLVCAREDRALGVADELLAAGIELHVQVVLVPGVNDGAELEATLTWLAEREGVVSVGIVPLGYTRHQSLFARSYESPRDAAVVLDQLEPWRIAFRERDGLSWVHAADEFYLNARREPPTAEAYDGFPQYENGIGLVRDFVDRFEAALEARNEGPVPPTGSPHSMVITGSLFAPVLQDLLLDAGLDSQVDVLPVPNGFFGGNVSVAGLLTGADILEAIRSDGRFSRYLVPDVVLNDSGLTLDDMTVAQLSERSGSQVVAIASDAEGLLSAIL
jgi:putative radical SAM enzyme (TIGR03279 family)